MGDTSRLYGGCDDPQGCKRVFQDNAQAHKHPLPLVAKVVRISSSHDFCTENSRNAIGFRQKRAYHHGNTAAQHKRASLTEEVCRLQKQRYGNDITPSKSKQ